MNAVSQIVPLGKRTINAPRQAVWMNNLALRGAK
jgi:hypothetical protein